MESNNIAKYVEDNINKACENNWITVYYQPIIRSVTGQVCGFESLARWIDPDMGLIVPYQFIGPLENSELITKLDCYIVDKVCHDIGDRLQNNLPVVPASVNFSRQDFAVCDMLEVVENAVKKYDIPRDLIHIEITESMIAEDSELMKDVIDSFRNRGYEIWMDDFGSEYSSLNMLKDFNFDVLKLDMRFLSTFTDKSKAIVKSTISMAKDIDVGTLAEGVETEEQVQFLRSIGCARLQGYYFSKPKPVDEVFAFLDEKGYTFEERKLRHYYNVASNYIRSTKSSLGLIEREGKNYKTLFMNDTYRQQIFMRVEDYERSDKLIFRKNSPTVDKFNEFAKILDSSRQEETFYYTNRGSYYRLKAKLICEAYGKKLYSTSIINISIDQRTLEREKIDTRIRELTQLFEDILIINTKNDSVAPLLGVFKYSSDRNPKGVKYSEALKDFCNYQIMPTERTLFLEFMDSKTMVERLNHTASKQSDKIFRVKQEDGTYCWRVISLLLLSIEDSNEVFMLIKKIPDEVGDMLNSFASELGRNIINETPFEANQYANLFENAVWNADLKFFWKDRERRFVGVSQSFLNFYGIKNKEEVIGKTDEEMQWHLDNDPYQSDEWEVIENGRHIVSVSGQCIVNGVVHNINCSKMPIYDNGKIVGLMGYFADNDEEKNRIGSLKGPSKIDDITGLMNPRAFVDTMMDYAIQFEDKGRIFGVILLDNLNHNRIEETYGNDFGIGIIKKIGEKIVEVTGQTAAVARVKRSVFAIIVYVDTKEELNEIAEKVHMAIDTINDLDGNSVTLKIKAVTKLITEKGVTADNIYAKLLGEISS